MPTATSIRPPRRISPSRWTKMSNRSKALAIARDAIHRVHIGQMTPMRSTWVRMSVESAFDDVQSLLAKGTRCQCCALGGAICGLAHFEDRMRYSDSDYDGDTRERLVAIFGDQNLRLIEHAFELGTGAFDASIEDEKAKRRACAFGRRRTTARGRFLAIWTNVLNNGGQFKP